MIDALISGRLRGTPSFRKAGNGSTFSTFKLAAMDRNGDSVLCSCITFNAGVQGVLHSMDDGEGITVSGEATMSSWPGPDGNLRHGLEIMVHGVLTAYHVGRKRRAGASAGGGDHE